MKFNYNELTCLQLRLDEHFPGEKSTFMGSNLFSRFCVIKKRNFTYMLFAGCKEIDALTEIVYDIIVRRRIFNFNLTLF